TKLNVTLSTGVGNTTLSNSVFTIFPTGLTNPGCAAFVQMTAASLGVGQTVFVEIQQVSGTSQVNATTGATTASAVILMPSQFTTNFVSASGTTLTVSPVNSSNIFTSTAVNTSTSTQFQGAVTGVSGLTT